MKFQDILILIKLHFHQKAANLWNSKLDCLYLGIKRNIKWIVNSYTETDLSFKTCSLVCLVCLSRLLKICNEHCETIFFFFGWNRLKLLDKSPMPTVGNLFRYFDGDSLKWIVKRSTNRLVSLWLVSMPTNLQWAVRKEALSKELL